MDYIIDFVESASVEDIQAYLVANNCTLIKEYSNFKKVYLVSCAAEPVASPLVESIINDDSAPIQLLGEIVTANNYFGLPNPNLPEITISTSDEKNWWMNYILKTAEFEQPSTSFSRKGSLSRVYIMDSGVDTLHPEFANSSVTNLFSFTGDFTDTKGHGTAIASVIAGSSCGLSSAQLQSVKVFDAVVATHQSDLLDALDAILTDFAQNSAGLGILNCSWYIAKNEYIEAKIRTLIDAGIYVVAAAGNSGTTIDSVTPASMPEVLTIGSFGQTLTPSDFSNYSNSSAISNTAGSTNSGMLDGWAPGEQVWVAVPGSTYGWVAGTSISAAIHSCVLAYNFDEYFLNGQLLEASSNRNMQYLSGMSLSHAGILDLSDPKYANSVNKISTLINKKSLDTYVQKQYAHYPFLVGKQNLVVFFNPQNTSTVEILTPLPAGFFVTPNGLLIGKAVLAEGVTHELFNAAFNITLLDGTVVPMNIDLAIMQPEFDPNTLPENDPFIAAVLLVSCNAGGTGVTSCDDDCEYFNGGQSSFCYTFEQTKTTFDCYCQ